ncbi:MAG TPA: Ig-like domain-containing protein [Nitrososphaerales archaeon]|nr:Ig-like domain-containing protein [Nitrososphaerales archaeon]
MKRRTGQGRLFLAGVALLLLFGFGLMSQNPGIDVAGWSGKQPGTCPNEYASFFVNHFYIDYENQNTDVLNNPGATIKVLASQSYTAYAILETFPFSEGGNIANGSTWIGTNSSGSNQGYCVGQQVSGAWLWGLNPNVGNGTVTGNEQLSMAALSVSIPSSYVPNPSGAQYYFTNHDNSSQVYYNILWIEQTSTTVSCQPHQDGTITCVPTVTGIQTNFSFGAPSGKVNFMTNDSGGGSCTLANFTSQSSRCSFTTTPNKLGTVNVTATYQGDYDQQGSSGTTTVSCCPIPTTTSTSTTQSSSTSSSSSSSSTSAVSTSSTSTNSTTSTTFMDTTTVTNSSITTTTNSTIVSSNSTQPEISTETTTTSGPFGFNYTESLAALAVSVLVIAGILGVSLRKSW